MKGERKDYVVARWVLSNLVFPIFMHLEVRGRSNVPKEGAYLAVSNHLSMMDIPLIQVTLPRVPRMMAKIELFKNPLVRLFMRWGGAVPVRRSVQDRAALRDAERTLASGAPFAVFPEGTRVHGGALTRGLPGAGLIASRSRVPVLPLAIEGTPNILRGKRPHLRARVRLSIGAPITPEELAAAGGLQEATDLIMRRVAALLPPEMRGVYAEQAEDERGLNTGGTETAQRTRRWR